MHKCYLLPAEKSNLAVRVITPVIVMVAVVGISIIVAVAVVVHCSRHTKGRQNDEQPLAMELQQEPDGLLEVDEEIFSQQGCERFVPTMVKKYDGMAAAAEVEAGNKLTRKQTTSDEPRK